MDVLSGQGQRTSCVKGLTVRPAGEAEVGIAVGLGGRKLQSRRITRAATAAAPSPSRFLAVCIGVPMDSQDGCRTVPATTTTWLSQRHCGQPSVPRAPYSIILPCSENTSTPASPHESSLSRLPCVAICVVFISKTPAYQATANMQCSSVLRGCECPAHVSVSGRSARLHPARAPAPQTLRCHARQAPHDAVHLATLRACFGGTLPQRAARQTATRATTLRSTEALAADANLMPDAAKPSWVGGQTYGTQNHISRVTFIALSCTQYSTVNRCSILSPQRRSTAYRRWPLTRLFPKAKQRFMSLSNRNSFMTAAGRHERGRAAAGDAAAAGGYGHLI